MCIKRGEYSTTFNVSSSPALESLPASHPVARAFSSQMIRRRIFHGTKIEQESTHQFFTGSVFTVAQGAFVIFTGKGEQQIANCRCRLPEPGHAKFEQQIRNRE